MNYKLIQQGDQWYFCSLVSGNQSPRGPYRSEREADIEARKHTEHILAGYHGGWEAHAKSPSHLANYRSNTEGASPYELLKRAKERRS